MVLLVVLSATVLVFGIVILVGTSKPLPAQASDAPAVVYVRGDVLLRGDGDTPTSLNFTDSSGHLYSTSVSGESYAVELPNNESYVVTIGWVGEFPWQKGVVSAGIFYLNQTSNTYQLEFSGYEAPPSYAQLSGQVNATREVPVSVSLSGPSGNFTAAVTGGEYSVQVPNLTSYQVEISWQGGGCSGGSISFDYNPGVDYNLACST